MNTWRAAKGGRELFVGSSIRMGPDFFILWYCLMILILWMLI